MSYVKVREEVVRSLDNTEMQILNPVWMEQERIYVATAENATRLKDYRNSTKNDTPSEENNTNDDTSNSDWNHFLPSMDTVENLSVLQFLKQHGLPEESDQRIQLLTRLNHIKEGDYPIEYGALCRYCPAFAETYSEERVLLLIQRAIKGEKPYPQEVSSAPLTEEEKALLYFVLPIQ